MLNCKQASQLISRSQDEKLPWSQRMQLKLHLMMCRGCTHYRQQLDFIKKAMRQYGNHGE